MSQELFDRLAILRVFQADTSTITQYDGSQGIVVNGYADEGKEFRSRMQDGSPGFRIRFNTQKTMSLAPNSGTIAIYNLGEKSRAYFQKPQNLVELYAGYGQSAKQIFKGNVSRGRTVKVGSDYVTNVEVQDGLYAVQNSMIDQSFNPGIQKNAVINNIADAIAGVPGIQKGNITGLPNDGYNNGIVLSGSAMEKLKEVCDGEDLYFYVEDQRLNILPIGTNNGKEAIKLSVNSGLVGIPERGNGRLSLRALLNPELTLLQVIELRSKFVNGLFVANQITNSGDTWGTEWYSNIECGYPGSDEAAF